MVARLNILILLDDREDILRGSLDQLIRRDHLGLCYTGYTQQSYDNNIH